MKPTDLNTAVAYLAESPTKWLSLQAPRAKKELAALRAVARAARRMTYRFANGIKREELDRALARLDKVSR